MHATFTCKLDSLVLWLWLAAVRRIVDLMYIAPSAPTSAAQVDNTGFTEHQASDHAAGAGQGPDYARKLGACCGVAPSAPGLGVAFRRTSDSRSTPQPAPPDSLESPDHPFRGTLRASCESPFALKAPSMQAPDVVMSEASSGAAGGAADCVADARCDKAGGDMWSRASSASKPTVAGSASAAGASAVASPEGNAAAVAAAAPRTSSPPPTAVAMAAAAAAAATATAATMAAPLHCHASSASPSPDGLGFSSGPLSVSALADAAMEPAAAHGSGGSRTGAAGPTAAAAAAAADAVFAIAGNEAPRAHSDAAAAAAALYQASDTAQAFRWAQSASALRTVLCFILDASDKL